MLTTLARRLSGLPSLLFALLALALALPVLAVLGSWLQWSGESANILLGMASTVLPDYALTTLGLCLMVAVGVTVLGLATAALVTLFDFPGRGAWEWLLLLPLAMPAYVVAYAYTDFLQFSGRCRWLCVSCWACKSGCGRMCAAFGARPWCSHSRFTRTFICWPAPPWWSGPLA